MEKGGTFFSKFASSIANLSGKPGTFVLAVFLVLSWAVSGPFFGFSDTWELVINDNNHHLSYGVRSAELPEPRQQGASGKT